MGLAEPRKRLKIAHNPNNVAWTQSTDSYGHRLMLSQGWKTGEGLGAKDTKRVSSQDGGRVTVTYKDDVLGLGAKLKSMDVEQSRAGLDAFQGLLGRLNGKSDAELEKEEKKVEDRKLAMWTQGKWGGMTFVPGGLLVQRDPFKLKDGGEEQDGSGSEESSAAKAEEDVEECAVKAKAQRKEEKRRKKAEKAKQASGTDESSDKQRRKEERRRKRGLEKGVEETEGKLSAEEDGTSMQEQPNPAIDETQSHTPTNDPSKEKKRKKKSKQPNPEPSAATKAPSPSLSHATDLPPQEASTAPTQATRNGRHILRGRNIQAKKLAFSDAKMLDEIFMRKT